MKRLLPLGLIGLGIILLIAVSGYALYRQKIQNPAAAPLPESVAGLSLSQSIAAGEAIAEFTHLHGSDFPLTSGAVGKYGPDHSVTLWVAGAPSQSTAGRLVDSMRAKIAGSSGRSPFVPVGERQSASRTVYELDGMGQKHFYFQSGRLVIWLAASPDRAEEVLTQTLDFYP